MQLLEINQKIRNRNRISSYKQRYLDIVRINKIVVQFDNENILGFNIIGYSQSITTHRQDNDHIVYMSNISTIVTNLDEYMSNLITNLNEYCNGGV